MNIRLKFMAEHCRLTLPKLSYFTATTTYSVKRDISCDIPHKIYNDGGEMNLTASITIRKGETKGTYETDYNGSPLV